MSANEPQVGTTTQLTGTSYAIMMIDLDIPTNVTGKTGTLLHWMQTGLTPATSATTLNTTSGRSSVFLLQNTANTAALAPYFGPSPPARTPLSHRYTQILVDTSALNTQATGTLQNAAASRRDFDAPTVLRQAGLQNSVVAGNFFVVTNPGPAQDGGSSNSTTGSGTSQSPQPSSTAVISDAGIISQPQATILCLLAAGAVFLTF